MAMDITQINEQPVLRVRPGPNDANVRGDIFGGWLMSQIDIAGSITACQVTKGMTVTVAVKDLTFLKSIFTYDLVSFFTEVVAIGTTSITIKVEVFAQRLPMSSELVKVSEAILVFVAVNKPGEKRVIEK